MFTGIVECVGEIRRVKPEGAGIRLLVDAPGVEGGASLGDSVAVDGVCLTVDALDGTGFWFRATRETLSRTSLGAARAGRRVNVERALAFGSRVGGHLVAGHVDGIGQIREIRPGQND